MADHIAKAVRCMGEDDFDLFGASNRSVTTFVGTIRKRLAQVSPGAPIEPNIPFVYS